MRHENLGDFSIQVFITVIAWSKLRTYSPYSFRKGALVFIKSPIRGLASLERKKTNSDQIPWILHSIRTISNLPDLMLNECKNKQKDEVQDRMYYAQIGNFPLKTSNVKP